MDRIDFLKKLIRYLLLLVIAVIVYALGSRVVTAQNCSTCPGNGVCKGKSDCNNY